MEISDIGIRLKKINDLMEKRINSELKEMDLTFSQHHVLLFLMHRDPHEASLKEAEKAFQVAQSTMAGLVSRLEEKELVTSFTDPGDRRIKMFRLTEKGEELCELSRQNFIAGQKTITEGLTEEEKKTLVRLLDRIYMNLQSRSEKKGETYA